MDENAARAETEDLGQAMTLPLGSRDTTMTAELPDAPGRAATPDAPPVAPEPGPSRAPSGPGPVGAAPATAPLSGGSVGHPTPPRSFYREAWRRFPRDLGYMLLTAALLATLYALFPAVVAIFGLRDVWNPFTLLLVFASLFVARWLGAFEKIRIGWAEPRPIRPVDWTPRWQQNWWTQTGSIVANPHSWLYLLHTAVVYPLAAFVTVGAGALLVAGFTWPLVFGLAFLFNDLLPGYVSQAQLALAFGVGLLGVMSMAGVVLLLPLWTRGSVLAHWWIDQGLLGGFRAEVLERRVAGLQASRAGAVTAEGQALRQIERDLHDGPQQRLVRLRMDLDAAGRAIDTAPETAKRLVAEASGHAKDALDELRALSRGFAPPILLDRGLVAALEALCSRTPMPVGLDVRLPEGLELATEIQRNVYFTVSELLTNATKHAGASTAGVYLGLVVDAAGHWWLAVSVTDDGRGGAAVRPGHGLEGLMGRMRALEGHLTVASPMGGPTEASARIPLGALTGVPTQR